jgi:hypothetical protein
MVKMTKILVALALVAGLAVMAATRAYAISFEFTPQALNAIADNEKRRTQVCVVNDIRQPRLEAKRKELLDNQQTARGMGRNDLADAMETDLAKIETELAEVGGNLARCGGAFLLGPQVEDLCRQLGGDQGTVCPAIAQAKASGQALVTMADSIERLVTGQGEQGWQITETPGVLTPDGRRAVAAVRRGNLQVAFRIGAERFATGKAEDAVPNDVEGRLREVNRSHGIWLREDNIIYVPFLSADVFGASGFAGETFQTLVGVKGAEGYVPLGPPVPVSILDKVAAHGVPLDATAWASLPTYDVIGIVGSRRVGDKDEFLYFIGIETQGIQPLMDQLMAQYRSQ